MVVVLVLVTHVGVNDLGDTMSDLVGNMVLTRGLTSN